MTASCFRWGHQLQQLENWADEVDGVLNGDDG